MTSLLSCKNLVAGYLNRPVLHDVSIDVQPGDVVALIGPNGHGKTTLLRTISGFLAPRKGEISMEGENISRYPVHKRVEAGLVHVPQGDQLFTEMTVEENLLMGAYLAKERESIFNQLENVFNLFPKLKDRRNQITSGLSGGERRMVGIGRGLMTNSKIMMLDEPSLGLAPLVIEQIYDALNFLRKEGLSFLVVEENPSRLINFADNLCLMDAGHIVWQGTADEAKSSGDILKTYLGGH
ncbi:MAG: ABC transporter ATP-binding protein [Pseudomonadota bacterium]